MPEDFEREHRDVLEEAHTIFRRRSAVRGQMWLDTTVQRELDMIGEKMYRAKGALDRLEAARENETPSSLIVDLESEFDDSLLDLINFAAFAIKKERRQR